MFGNSVPRFAEDTHFYYSYDTWYTRLRAIRCLIKDFSQNACSRDDTRTIVSRHVKHVLRRRLAVVTLGLPVKTSRHEVAQRITERDGKRERHKCTLGGTVMAADDPCSVADGGAKRLSDFVVDPDSSLRRLSLPGFPLLPRRLSPLPPAALRRKRAPERKSAFFPTTSMRIPSTATNCHNVEPAKIRIVSTFFFTTLKFLYSIFLINN